MSNKQDIKNAILAMFEKYPSGKRMRRKDIKNETEKILREKYTIFELHDAELQRAMDDLIQEGSLKNDERYIGYQLAPKRRQEDLHKIKMDLELQNSIIFNLISSNENNVNEIVPKCHEHIQNLLELHKKITYRRLSEYDENVDEIQEIQRLIDYIDTTIRTIHHKLEERDRKLCEKLQNQVKQSVYVEHVSAPYSCDPYSSSYGGASYTHTTSENMDDSWG